MRMSPRVLVAALVLLVPEWGASPSSLPELLSELSGAKSVVYVGSYLRHPQVAQALHRLVTKQGGTVALLTSPYTYLDKASYFLGLYLAGAYLYLGPVDEYFLIVNNQVAFRGRGLGASGPLERLEGEEVAAALARVREALRRSSPFLYSPEAIVLHFWR